MSRLRRLELHYLVSGVDLCLISSFAPALLHLTVCDSKVFCSDPALLGGGGGAASTLLGGGASRALLPRLLSCHLLRVSYEGGAEAALLGHAPALTRLHQEAGPAITDELVQRLVAEGRLDNLGISIQVNIYYLLAITPRVCRGADSGGPVRADRQLGVRPDLAAAAGEAG